MWTDNETTRDYLGYQIHANVVRGLVTDPSLSPLTIGLFGDWGGGKSSIIRMLQRDLDPSNEQSQASGDEKETYKKFACIYFNGWQLEGYDDSRAALLSSILNELGRLERFGPKLKKDSQKLLKSVDWMRFARGVVSMGAASLAGTHAAWVAPVTGVLFNTIDNVKATKGRSGERPESDVSDGQTDEKGLDLIREFRDSFAELLANSKVKKMIVLIDDLDRCMPERLVDNLEAIKLFLNLGNTAFVIAADERIVRQAIALRYHTNAYENKDANNVDAPIVTDYLEKLIQIPYRIPRLSPDETLTYMEFLYCEKHLEDDEIRKCISKYVEQQIDNRYAPLTKKAILSGNISKESEKQRLGEDLGICETIAPAVTEILKGNPRQIKRFLNAFELRLQLAEKSHIDDIQRDVLAKLMVLEYSHPAQYRQLYDWQVASDGYPKQLRILEKDDLDSSNDLSQKENGAPGEWTKPELVKWARLAPPLTNIDLRSYFWLTRDTLDVPLANTITISPFLQRMVNSLLSDSDAKRTEAEKRAHELTSSDANTVAVALANFIIRNPEEPRGYKVLSSLAQHSDVYVNELVRAIKAVEAKDLPPFIVVSLGNLRDDSTPLGESIRDLISELAQHPDTRVGRAATAVMKRG